jgi:hypothetical protein
VQATVDFKWEHWCRRLLWVQLCLYLVWLFTFNIFTILFQVRSPPHSRPLTSSGRQYVTLSCFSIRCTCRGMALGVCSCPLAQRGLEDGLLGRSIAQGMAGLVVALSGCALVRGQGLLDRPMAQIIWSSCAYLAVVVYQLGMHKMQLKLLAIRWPLLALIGTPFLSFSWFSQLRLGRFHLLVPDRWQAASRCS